MGFSKDFLWGAATASAQIEGAWDQDGKGPSIWDVLYPEHTRHNEHPHDACDHYHRYKEDVALMKQLGLKAYRFSISWPRVIPDGTGEVNPQGIQFYKNLVAELRAADIEPIVTLYHWDLPYALHLRGGWQNPEIVQWFANYTKVVVEALSDQVKYWLTFNEPQCFIGISYVGGEHAPFYNEPLALPNLTRNVLFAHAEAVKTIRKYAKTKPLVGYAPTGTIYEPVDESPEAIEKARQDTFATYNVFTVSWWCDPVLLGKNAPAAPGCPVFTEEELAELNQPLDFLGFNVYQAAGQHVPGSGYSSNTWVGSPITTMDWPMTPNALYWTIRFLNERYGKDILITENGMANNDWVMLDGAVHDPQRIDFVHRYLKTAKRAADEGYGMVGYLYWSLMDNYEWAWGYGRRFGLIYVDYRTMKRTIKDSGYWYKQVIESNGENLD